MSDHQPRNTPKTPYLLVIIVLGFAVIAVISGIIVRNFYSENRAGTQATTEPAKP